MSLLMSFGMAVWFIDLLSDLSTIWRCGGVRWLIRETAGSVSQFGIVVFVIFVTLKYKLFQNLFK